MSRLIDHIHQHHVHHFNPIVAKGIAVSQMEKALDYIDNAFRLCAESFPAGLEYIGYKKCTVEQEYNYLVNRKNSQHSLELAPSDIYMVNYLFRLNGEDLPPRPILVPFVGKGGLITLRGNKFTILPVLADETISVSKEDIFVPFLSAKVTFKRMQYWFRQDGAQRTEYLVYAKIYNHDPNKQARRSTRANNSVKALHTMAHYLFCKYGVRETFMRFYNTPIVIIDGVVDRKLYPEEKYSIFTSSGIKPRTVRMKHYRASNIHIVIDKDNINNGTLGLLCGLFYILDHYPDRFTSDTLDNTIDELNLWRIILGHAIFRNNNSEGDFLNKINEHIDILDQYVDDMTREGLALQGFAVDNLYDLMALLIFDFTEVLMKTNQASMFGKMLSVNRYVLADIVKAISVFKFKMASLKGKELTAQDVNKHLAKCLKPEVIFNGLNKHHNEIVSQQCAGDNIMFNHTSRLILQENATGVSRRKAAMSFNDPSKLLDVSIAVGGSILALPKSEPTGRSVLNPYQPLDHTYKIKPLNDMLPLINYIQSQIKQK